MTWFGKTLAVLNILGAAAFVVLAFMDFAKRESWAYANYVHDVAFRGLPLDDKSVDQRESPLKYNLADETKKEWFGATPISTQVEEVDRVKKALDGQIAAAAGGNASKESAEMARALLPFARHNSEREWLLSVRGYLPDGEAKMRARLHDAFRPAVTACLAQVQADHKTFPLKLPQAFTEACRAKGGDSAVAFEQMFLQRLPGGELLTGKVTAAAPNSLTFKDAAGKDQTVKVGDDVAITIDGVTVFGMGKAKAQDIKPGSTVTVVKKDDAVIRVYANTAGPVPNPVEDALAAAANNVPANPMNPEQGAQDQALAFLKTLRGDEKATLRQPGDAAGARDTVDEVCDAALTAVHDQLKAQLDDRFDQARNGPKSLAPASTDRLRDAQRAFIADYLFNTVEVLDPEAAKSGVVSAPAYVRFIHVVGANQAAQEVSDQGRLLQTLGEELQAARDDERSDFTTADSRLIEDLKNRAVRLHNAVALRDGTAALLDKQKTVTQNQQTKVDELEKELAKARAQTDGAIVELRQLSDSLHDMRTQSRDLLGENLELEKEISDLEKNR